MRSELAITPEIAAQGGLVNTRLRSEDFLSGTVFAPSSSEENFFLSGADNDRDFHEGMGIN